MRIIFNGIPKLFKGEKFYDVDIVNENSTITYSISDYEEAKSLVQLMENKGVKEGTEIWEKGYEAGIKRL